MSRSNLFLKVEIEHDPDEAPDRIGEQICRQLLKVFVVRSAEVSSYTTVEE